MKETVPIDVGNILPDIVAAVILAAFAYLLSYLFPDMAGDLRVVIAGLVAIVGGLGWHYAGRASKRFKQWLLKQWRYIMVVILWVSLEVLLYLAYVDWKTIAFSIAHFVLMAVAAWVLAPYYTKAYTHELSYPEEFREDFQQGLENWEYRGEWRIEREGDGCILIVTESRSGGIAKPCVSWKDYVVEFETRIVNGNTSWIIRAEDTDNYVMLQCQPELLYPHFRTQGRWENLTWTLENPVRLPFRLPLNTWFGVHIEVRGTLLLVTVTLDGREREILRSSRLLEPPTAPVSYQVGSVGFRESAEECANFRNVRVKRLF